MGKFPGFVGVSAQQSLDISADKEVLVEAVAVLHGDSNQNNCRIAFVDGCHGNMHQSPKQKYPLNYKNYKVCREVRILF